MSDYLPNEVIIDILKRLPADSLIRCRCVCKSWYSLISTPHFITNHLNFNLSKPKTQHQLLFRHFDHNLHKHRITLHSSNDPFPRNHFSKYLKYSFLAIHISHLCLDREVEDKGGFFAYPSDFVELDCSYERINQISTIVGSSNGLLCLTDRYRNDSQYQNLYVLWNPSIHKAIFLQEPDFRLNSNRHYALSHGFGYDPATDDYKLVRVVYVDGSVPPQVEMYTLRSGGWRYLTASGPANVIADRTLSVFMNGVVHWLAQTSNGEGNIRNLIVVFDIGHEVFDEMPVPKSLEGMEHLNMEVAAVDGLLVLVPCNGNVGEESYSIWVMREYGVVESWTKILDIDVGVGLRRVVGFTKNGEVLVIKDGNLLSYEPSSQEIFNPHIRSRTESFYLNTYVESLVLLNGADGE
ncbi:F-box/kelch-repeat protein At3g06240-like [Quercus robur]|uniref:F-box/kelch-repeat protein At3g06240-like n=1 Tax=Quercus robur TaxID=38942 RepID=UPI002162EB7E|nr:F-box/kelch-repeat protein At3g06240-like [Quercus robur]